MQTFSALLAICAGNSPVPGEFPAQRPVTRSFDVFFDLRLNKWWSKQSWGWWFETLSRLLWRHCNDCISTCGLVHNNWMIMILSCVIWFLLLYDHHHFKIIITCQDYGMYVRLSVCFMCLMMLCVMIRWKRFRMRWFGGFFFVSMNKLLIR